ncbi:MAG: class I SAM-dependent methyltransferase [Candidatus Hinthialibacter antarcticus]|nr:class I SAM-dependent methyltransferase [Candidatus Hinthialibacter antarcticus]
MRSPIYWHPFLYELSIRLLYGRRYHERYHAVATWVQPGESVTDVCAGDCAVFRYALQEKNIRYLACDLNHTFLQWAQRRNIQTQSLNVLEDEIPAADCIIMMGSLCQFIPNEKAVIEKMIASARRCVILTEPVRNWSNSEWAIVRWLGRFASRLDSGEAPLRFTQSTLTPVLKAYGFQTIQPIAGGREVLAVLHKPSPPTSGAGPESHT